MVAVRSKFREVRELTDAEIVKVVDKLVGEINPIADSSHDSKVFDNINLMGSVIDTLVCRIGNMVCDNQDSQFSSVEKCTSRAIEILETIKANINEYLEQSN